MKTRRLNIGTIPGLFLSLEKESRFYFTEDDQEYGAQFYHYPPRPMTIPAFHEWGAIFLFYKWRVTIALLTKSKHNSMI